jgi:hypothetical protein
MIGRIQPREVARLWRQDVPGPVDVLNLLRIDDLESSRKAFALCAVGDAPLDAALAALQAATEGCEIALYRRERPALPAGRAGSDEALADGEHRGLHAVLDVQLLQDARYVMPHRRRREIQGARDLRVALALDE